MHTYMSVCTAVLGKVCIYVDYFLLTNNSDFFSYDYFLFQCFYW